LKRLAALLLLLAWLSPGLGAGAIAELRSASGFEETVADLEFAITERNLRIVGRNEIGAAIRAEGDADFPRVTVLHYCSLAAAREALLIDPAYIVQLTCRIAVYEKDGAVHLGALLLPEDSADPALAAYARRMNALTEEILRYAAGGP
jgi:hypothetical protein